MTKMEFIGENLRTGIEPQFKPRFVRYRSNDTSEQVYEHLFEIREIYLEFLKISLVIGLDIISIEYYNKPNKTNPLKNSETKI